VKALELEKRWTEVIPAKRRSRRNSEATKSEAILVCRRKVGRF
jgi:hypothetical protein